MLLLKGRIIPLGLRIIMSLCFSVAIATLAACTTSSSKVESCTNPSISISTPEGSWHYQGPGVAASFLLMSSSGPTGAAIGVAIDQGIQKDLLEVMEDPSAVIHAAVNEVFSSSEVHLVSSEEVSETAMDQKGWFILWNRFGFVSDMSSERMTSPVAMATVYQNGQEFRAYSLAEEGFELEFHSLDNMLNDSELANQMLFQAANNLTMSISDDVRAIECSQ